MITDGSIQSPNGRPEMGKDPDMTDKKMARPSCVTQRHGMEQSSLRDEMSGNLTRSAGLQDAVDGQSLVRISIGWID